MPHEAGGSTGEGRGDILTLADENCVGVVFCKGLDDEVRFAGFVSGGVEVMDFAGGEPGALASSKEVVHGAGMVKHAYCWV